MEGWHDPAAAARWDAAHASSPARGEELELLLAVLARVRPREILDVGVGTGIVAERVLALLPEARLTGIDFSGAMLELARKRLQPFEGRCTLLQGDLRTPASIDLGRSGFDAAVSVQTLHHVADAAKAEVFAWLGRVLGPGGLFLLRDKVTVPPALFDAYAAVWQARGDEVAESAAGHEASLSRKGDDPAPLEAQLAWLRAAGFEPGVLHAEAHYALIAGAKP